MNVSFDVRTDVPDDHCFIVNVDVEPGALVTFHAGFLVYIFGAARAGS